MPLELRLQLKEFRLRAGLSQDELGKRAGISRRGVIYLENNTTRRIDLDTLDRLARALKVEPGELLHRARTTE